MKVKADLWSSIAALLMKQGRRRSFVEQRICPEGDLAPEACVGERPTNLINAFRVWRGSGGRKNRHNAGAVLSIALYKSANICDRTPVECAPDWIDVEARGGRSDNDRVALPIVAREHGSRGRIVNAAAAQGASSSNGNTQTQDPRGEQLSCIRKSGHESCLSRYRGNPGEARQGLLGDEPDLARVARHRLERF